MSAQVYKNQAQEFFNWWVGELADMLPASPSRSSKDVQRGLTIVLQEKTFHLQWENGKKVADIAPKFSSALALDKYNAAIAQDKKLQTDTCNICIPAKRILNRTISLPISTEENLQNVVAYEMDRYTPFKSDDVYFDVKVQERDKKEQKITVVLSVIKKAVLDEVLEFANSAGLSIRSIFSAGDGTTGEVENYTFLKEHQLGSGQRSSSLINKYLFIFAMLLGLIALVLPIVKNFLTAEQYKSELLQMEADISEARDLQSKYKAIKQDVEFISKQSTNSVRVLELLNELTKIVPDDTSLSRLSLEEGIVRIRGLSASASKLISIIDSAENYTGVRFVAPVTQNSKTGKESFTIEFKLLTEK